MRKKNQKLNTRAGSAPNRINEENKFRMKSPCNLPFTQVIVRPDGTLGKCCNDPLSKITLGDLNHQTLREIWRGRAYQELRKEMYFNGRQNIPGCEFCDIFGLYNYLPPSAMTNEFKRLVDEISLRKNFGARYILDTTPLSKNLFERFKVCGVGFDGFINIRGDAADKNYKFVTLQQALSERAFILVPLIYYDDGLFDFLHGMGYRYGKDYLCCTPGV
ncbi:MAG: SPASM domain-containing protein [Selenomonadaceae bacterium]|nr:SPASM domain-containing protein [Selenomonadaceae bacterium]